MIIRITNEELEKAGVPYKASTLKKWRYEGKHPELFVKLERRLAFDVDKFYELVNQARKERDMKLEQKERKIENG